MGTHVQVDSQAATDEPIIDPSVAAAYVAYSPATAPSDPTAAPSKTTLTHDPGALPHR